MASNVVMFPGAINPEAIMQKSNDVTYELIENIVHTLNDNGIDIYGPDMELKISSIIKLLKAIIEDNLGLENKNIEIIENLIVKLKEDI